MTTEQKLNARGNGSCEVCESKESLSVYEVPPHSDGNEDESILVCEVCKAQLEKRVALDANHWGCLNTSMWSEVPAVKVGRVTLYSVDALKDWLHRKGGGHAAS